MVLIILTPVAMRTKIQPLGSYDQNMYIGVAYDLLQSGRYTDGFGYAAADSAGERPSGMRFAPLYPALVATSAALDPEFRTGVECVVQHYATYATCPNAAKLVRSLQFGMLAFVFIMVWWLALVLTRTPLGAWIGLVLALMTSPYLMRSVDYIMTETASLFLSTAFTCAAVAATRSRHPWRAVTAAGVALGLAALTRPAFLYLFYAAVLVALFHAAYAIATHRRAYLRLLAVFVAAFALPVGPWIARNAVVLNRPELSFGYASHTLVQRISYDAMTWREYAMFYVCGLPDGNGLGAMIAGSHTCDRFGMEDRPDTFYAIGNGPLLAQTLVAAGGYEHHLGFLLRNYVVQQPVKHLLVAVPMALRGAWVDHYWGLILGCVSFVLTVGALRRRDLGFLMLSMPPWFMLAFNAAVAVNQVRYNLMLVPLYAVSGALVVERLIARHQKARNARTRRLAS